MNEIARLQIDVYQTTKDRLEKFLKTDPLLKRNTFIDTAINKLIDERSK